MASTTDLRTNVIIRWNGQLHRVTEFHHHAPGNWRAMVIMKLKNVQTGKTVEERVRAGSDVEIVRVDKTPMQFLYREGDSFHFMDNQTFEQIEIADDAIGEPAQFLKEGDMCDVLFYDQTQVLGVDVPFFANLKVTESAVALRGDTTTNVNKLVTVETGAQVQVPAFINEGDVIRVDTRNGSYIERASK
ncbi:MAG: elongation factor P [Roseiflexaceae bacterium]|nr:elongation factor P [Roseiflexaceae bacterium]